VGWAPVAAVPPPKKSRTLLYVVVAVVIIILIISVLAASFLYGSSATTPAPTGASTFHVAGVYTTCLGNVSTGGWAVGCICPCHYTESSSTLVGTWLSVEIYVKWVVDWGVLDLAITNATGASLFSHVCDVSGNTTLMNTGPFHLNLALNTNDAMSTTFAATGWTA